MAHDRLRRQRGSALILVFWCLILLGMAVFGVVSIVALSVDSTSYDESFMEARALASSGVALGSNPQLLNSDPLFSYSAADGGRFKVTIESEGARLNLNYILLSNHREILVNLFNQWGLRPSDADHVADCLYDWITPGSLPSLNGAKADQYQREGLEQRPTGQPFASMAEVHRVMGISLLDSAMPNWQDNFTLWSSGPLNINEAPPERIAAVFGLNPKRVDAFTSVRNGPDGIVGTLDDVKVTDWKTFQSDLGLPDLAMKELGDQISLNDSARRVVSVGHAKQTQVVISAVIRPGNSPIQYLLWSEQ